MTSTPVSLLERLRKFFEPKSWERFVELYTPLMFDSARRAGLQEADAADLVQDVFAVLVQELRRLPVRRRHGFHTGCAAPSC